MTRLPSHNGRAASFRSKTRNYCQIMKQVGTELLQRNSSFSSGGYPVRMLTTIWAIIIFLTTARNSSVVDFPNQVLKSALEVTLQKSVVSSVPHDVAQVLQFATLDRVKYVFSFSPCPSHRISKFVTPCIQYTLGILWWTHISKASSSLSIAWVKVHGLDSIIESRENVASQQSNNSTGRWRW